MKKERTVRKDKRKIIVPNGGRKGLAFSGNQTRQKVEKLFF